MPDSQNYDNNEPMPRRIDPSKYYIGSEHNWDVKSPSVADFHERHSHFKDGTPTAPAPLGAPHNTAPRWRIWDTDRSGQGHTLRQSPQPTEPLSCQSSSNTRMAEDRPDSTSAQLNGSSSKATDQPPCTNALERHGFLKHDDAESLRLFLERQRQGPTDALSSDVLSRVESLARSQGVTKESLPDRTAAVPPRGGETRVK